ncbi:MAG: ComF family protein [Oscillospiraceae bacterium]|nr:ComF family protein [Oscillospiraceae bacterium]
MFHRLWTVLFPPRCILCRRFLKKEETDLCHHCREHAPEVTSEKFKFSFLARWCAIWYYKDDVRNSILRYKFNRRQSYADAYGRLLAMKLQRTGMDNFDVLTWVPVSFLRRWKRGFDQTENIALVVARELNVPAIRTLKKIRHTPPQSGISNAAARRANVLNAYRVIDSALVRDKSILLLDDVLTTGATASECAKTLCLSGAREVSCAVVAVAPHGNK